MKSLLEYLKKKKKNDEKFTNLHIDIVGCVPSQGHLNKNHCQNHPGTMDHNI